MRTITVSEDFGARRGDPMAYCATLVDDPDPERAGFGATEQAALAMLAGLSGDSISHFLEGATIERMGVR